jgi:tetratricopeptide (TPR) repeat protein
MKLFIFALTLLLPVYALAQQPRIAGFITEQNSGKKRVQGVMVKAAAPARTNQVPTLADGSFTLVFQDMLPGQQVQVQAEKKGWQIVNEKEMITGIPENAAERPLKVIMCSAQKLELLRKEYYNITDQYITRQYEKQKASVDYSKTGWEDRTKELENQLASLRQQIITIADEYSRTNLDDLTETEKQAFELFKTGRIEEGIKLRNSMKQAERLQIAKRRGRELDSIISIHTRNLKKLAIENTLIFDFKNAERAYQDLVDADTTNFENVLQFTEFLNKQNQYDKAINWMQLALRHAGGHPVSIIFANTNLAGLYFRKRDFAIAKKTYLFALDLCQKFEKFMPGVFDASKATILLSLSLLYYELQDYAAEEDAIVKSRELWKRLAAKDINLYGEFYAEAVNFSGIYYKRKQRYKEAEDEYNAALTIFSNQKNEIYRPVEVNMAQVYTCLGDLYQEQHLYTKAITAFEQVRDIYQRLAGNNSAAYQPKLATAQSNLSLMYQIVKNFDAAEKASLSAIELGTLLARNNPAVFEPELAAYKRGLADLYVALKKMTLAATIYKEALDLFNKQPPDIKIAFEPQIALTHSNMAAMYLENNNFPAAEKSFLSAIQIYERLVKKDTAQFEPNLALFKYNLSNVYVKNSNYAAAEKFQMQAGEIWERLSKKNPDVYDPYLGRLKIGQGGLYRNMHNATASEKVVSEAISIYERLIVTNAAVYEVEYARALNDLGQGNLLNQEYTAAEKWFNKALPIWRRLVIANAAVNEFDLALTLGNIGMAYTGLKNYVQAEKNLAEAITIMKRMAITNAAQIEPYLSGIVRGIGDVCMETRNYPGAEKNYTEALEIRQRLAKTNKDLYEPEMAEIYSKLANLFIMKQNFPEAERLIKLALESSRYLMQKNIIQYGLFFCSIAATASSIYTANPTAERIAAGKVLLKELEGVLSKIPDSGQKNQFLQFYNQILNHYAQFKTQAP